MRRRLISGCSSSCIHLGGSGGGIADNEEEFVEIIQNGLRLSRVGQVFFSREIYRWLEGNRIRNNVMVITCITVCNMENLDPVGVHTGDSIVVAPSQTLEIKSQMSPILH